MTASASASCFRATLISMPWALFNRPSLQLAALKAYVEREMEAEITTLHPFLHIAAAIGIATNGPDGVSTPAPVASRMPRRPESICA